MPAEKFFYLGKAQIVLGFPMLDSSLSVIIMTRKTTKKSELHSQVSWLFFASCFSDNE